MKRHLSIVLLVVLVFSLIGCKNNKTNPDAPTFYYIKNDAEFDGTTNIVTSFYPDINKSTKSHKDILSVYFNGPTTYECRSPFPSGTMLEDFRVMSNRAILVLSPQFATITGAERTIAFACLTKTVIELTGVKSVQIGVEGVQLDGEDYITFDGNSFTYSDDLPVN